MVDEQNHTNSTVFSQDGTIISYKTSGEGPSVIVIPGALSTSNDFQIFSELLSDSFTVHIMDRRGRGKSGPQGTDYSIRKECEDFKAVQESTGATLIFGHSFGGLVTLEAARENQALKKIAVYEPGVSIQHSIPTDWLTEYEHSMNIQDFRGAFAIFIRALGPVPKWLPLWYFRIIVRLIVRGDRWNQIKSLLSANLNEHREVGHLDSTYNNYKSIQAETLLMSGGKSAESVHQVIDLLDQTILQTKTMMFRKLDHLAPVNKPDMVAKNVKRFFME